VEQVERHIGELEIFRQRVNAYPKHFEMYIDFKSISAAWELGPGIFCAKVGPSLGPKEIKMAFEVSIGYV